MTLSIEKLYETYAYPQLPYNDDLDKNDPPSVILDDGTRTWYKDHNIQAGVSHRDQDRPARVEPSGSQRWFQNGARLRLFDRPAIVQHAPNGTHFYQEWTRPGKGTHRDNNLPDIGFPLVSTRSTTP